MYGETSKGTGAQKVEGKEGDEDRYYNSMTRALERGMENKAKDGRNWKLLIENVVGKTCDRKEKDKTRRISESTTCDEKGSKKRTTAKCSIFVTSQQ